MPMVKSKIEEREQTVCLDQLLHFIEIENRQASDKENLWWLIKP